MKKSISLIEIIIAIVIMGVVMFGIASFEVTHTSLYVNSTAKTRVMNDATLVLDRISRDATRAIGDITVVPANYAIRWFPATRTLWMRLDTSPTVSCAQNLQGNGRIDATDATVTYTFDPVAHTIIRTVTSDPCDAGGAVSAVTLTRRATAFNVTVENGVTANPITYDIGVQMIDNTALAHSTKNPWVLVRTRISAPAFSAR